MKILTPDLEKACEEYADSPFSPAEIVVRAAVASHLLSIEKSLDDEREGKTKPLSEVEQVLRQDFRLQEADVRSRIKITRRAESQLAAAVDWYAMEYPSSFDSWFDGLLSKLHSIQIQPGRFPLSGESQSLFVSLRQVLFGLTERKTHQVLYAVRPSAPLGSPGDIVILHACLIDFKD